MHPYVLSVVTLLCFAPLISTQDDGCSLSVASSSLVIVDGHFQLPLAGHLNLYRWERFYVRCPSGTYNPNLQEDGEQLSCEGNTTIRIDRTNLLLEFSELKCVQNLAATVRRTNTSCLEKGTEVEVGFEIFKTFVPAYTVCFDQYRLVPLNLTFLRKNESYHGISSSPDTNDNFFVDSAHLYGDLDINRLYIDQADTFEFLGLSKYLSESVYLIPATLLTNGVFNYSLPNQGIYDLINVVPQWSNLRQNYLDLIFTSLHYKGILLSIATSGVASLPDSAGNMVEVYLHHDTVPVPRWILLKGTDETSSIYTFGVYNNPYFDEAEVTDEFEQFCSFSRRGCFPADNLFLCVCIEDPEE